MGYLAQVFKTAIIKLTPKPDIYDTKPVNYTPVSLLEVTGKTLEKIVNRRLIEYLETNILQPSTQHRFRRGRGTNTATTTAPETIKQPTINND